MITREKILTLLATAGDDLMVSEYKDEISVTINDFAYFDEEGAEVYRELNDAGLIYNTIYKTLETEARQVDNDYYTYFHFDDFTVCWWGCASSDV